MDEVNKHQTSIGIAFGNGEPWSDSRRFTIRHLRDLGMGKTKLEDAIQYEAMCLVQDFRKHTDKAQPLPLSVGVAFLNVVWKMVAGKAFSFSKLVFNSFIHFSVYMISIKQYYKVVNVCL